ncbi:phosphotransferase family enzyme [Tamaricihabitans halophyticus]|uniref:Phosphotransferase family enzyme n=2 Tax=Tamaricihabitans halophyticus TaxID=1262583 RepID=A0A4R2PY06_9PSEU|nr:phosphotransferase family enzyme [Tamaricihabitans halophyticus]
MAGAAAASDVLSVAGRLAHVDTTDAELIRDGANTLYRLPHGIVARIGRAGTAHIARRELRVARWLANVGVPAIQPVAIPAQPHLVRDRPVTWWELLPPHRVATPSELGAVLNALHRLAVPSELDLPFYDPFVGIDHAMLADAVGIEPADRDWLVRRFDDLRERYRQADYASSRCVLHGDAWQGNIAVTETGRVIVLDLERFAIGPPEWDLVQLAVDYTDFARLGTGDYQAFVSTYGGYDVTGAPRYRLLADIQEFRWVCFTLSKTATRPEAIQETRHRIHCLRGDVPRPWTWTAL